MGQERQALILLVEDDLGVARLEQLRLERAGYTVVTTATAEAAFRARDGGGYRSDRSGPAARFGNKRAGALPPDQGSRARCARHSGHRPSRRATAGRSPAVGGARLRAQDAQLLEPSGADRQPRAASGRHRARPGRIACAWLARTRCGATSSSTRSPPASAPSRRCARPKKTCG